MKSTWTSGPAHHANRKSRDPAFHPELPLSPRSLTSSISLLPLGRFGTGLLGTEFLPPARGSPCGYWQDSPLLASVGFTPAPPCLESICPQHYLEKSPMCVSYGCAELHKWNKAIKEGQEFLPDAARTPYSQRGASMFALRYWNKKLFFTRLPYLLAPQFSLEKMWTLFWRVQTWKCVLESSGLWLVRG